MAWRSGHNTLVCGNKGVDMEDVVGGASRHSMVNYIIGSDRRYFLNISTREPRMTTYNQVLLACLREGGAH